MSFSFGFFPQETEHEPSKTSEAQMQKLKPQATSDSTNNDPPSQSTEILDWDRSMKKPLHWIPREKLQALLEERCDQELVCQEIQLDQSIIDDHDEDNQNTHLEEDTDTNQQSVVRYVDVVYSSFVQNEEESSNLSNTTVVQPGIYEGGLQLWECSVDLVHYLHKRFQQDETMMLGEGVKPKDYSPASASAASSLTSPRPPRILELGCGHGLPSMYWIRRALQQQHHQQQQIQLSSLSSSLPQFVLTDYNAPVVSNVVVSNLILNAAQTLLHPSNRNQSNSLTNAQACRVIADMVDCATGDWKGLIQKPESDDTTPPQSTFDFILAAETLYTLESTRETALLIHALLSKDNPHATAWIATKRYYFGVGGGTQAFQQECRVLGLHTEIAKVYDNGRQNIREIIQVQHHSTN